MNKIIENEGDLCKGCNQPVIYKESKFRLKKLNKSYFYKGFYACTTAWCNKVYYKDKFKVIVEENTKLF